MNKTALTENYKTIIKPLRMSLSTFCLGLPARGLPFMLLCPVRVPWGRLSFPLARDYILEMALRLGMGTRVYFFQLLGPSGTDLCKPCACCLSLCELRCVPPLLCLEVLESLVSSICSGSYPLSIPLFCCIS
jgi:hypothetical protein